MAGTTRLELATFGVTGRRSNQLNYAPVYSKKVIAPKPEDLDFVKAPPSSGSLTAHSFGFYGFAPMVYYPTPCLIR